MPSMWRQVRLVRPQDLNPTKGDILLFMTHLTFPSQNDDEPLKSRMSPFALVVVGMCGSGKSSVAAYLKRQGWPVVRFGDITIRELERRGLAVCEANERRVRQELRAEHGMDAYAKMLLPTIRDHLARGPVVLDGLYSWSEYKYLLGNLQERLLVVAVVAPRKLRYARLASRPERPLSPEEAFSRDLAEIETLEKGGPIAMADETILNTGSLEQLEQAVEVIIRERVASAQEGCERGASAQEGCERGT
jgi:dephospho-CoA kinase